MGKELVAKDSQQHLLLNSNDKSWRNCSVEPPDLLRLSENTVFHQLCLALPFVFCISVRGMGALAWLKRPVNLNI